MGYPKIVYTNVSITGAPTPNGLQRTGMFISQGATTLAAGTTQLLTQASDLTAILTPPRTVGAAVESGTTTTVTTSTPHGYTVGGQVMITLAGFVPAGYNGTYLATVTTTTQFTVTTTAGLGSVTTLGTYVVESATELVQMVNTFFIRSGQSVYVLELGPGYAVDGAAALTTYLQNNPNAAYAFVAPRYWDADSAVLALAAQYTANDSKLYFLLTTTLANYHLYPTTNNKSINLTLESPTAASTEFAAAGRLWDLVARNPSPTTPSSPFSYNYAYGTTPYPTFGNNTLFANLKTANVNYVGTGAEGGLSNAIWYYGNNLDGNDLSYWYSIDWAQIQTDQALSYEIITGSQQSPNPLIYDQDGINRLQASVASVMRRAVNSKLATGTVVTSSLSGAAFQAALNAGTFDGQIVVNAVPFYDYLQNGGLSNYQAGIYSGLSVQYIVSRGFLTLVFNLNVVLPTS